MCTSKAPLISPRKPDTGTFDLRVMEAVIPHYETRVICFSISLPLTAEQLNSGNTQLP